MAKFSSIQELADSIKGKPFDQIREIIAAERTSVEFVSDLPNRQRAQSPLLDYSIHLEWLANYIEDRRPPTRVLLQDAKHPVSDRDKAAWETVKRIVADLEAPGLSN